MKNAGKKGAIELQLNWILVLVIGGIILFFFIAVVAKQKSITELQITGELVKDLDSLISGAQAASGGASIVPVPDEEMSFSCNEYLVKGQRLPLRSRIVFGSSVIDKNEGSVLVWSLPWSVPYKITDFLYITSPGHRYIFAYPEEDEAEYAEFVNDFVTDKLNKDVAYIQQGGLNNGLIDFQDKGSRRIKVILFGNLRFRLPGFAYTDKTVVVRVPFFDPEMNTVADKIEYYVYDADADDFILQGESTYINKESLLGAVFTDNVFDYDCIMKKAWRNLNAVNLVQWEKAKILRDANICSICYDSDLMILYERIDQNTKNTEEWARNVAEVYGAAGGIQQKNENIERLSMPLLY